MIYSDVKSKLLSLFDSQKLDEQSNDDEWGFLNETDKNIQKIGYATSLTPEIIYEAIQNHVDFIITHHDAWDFVYGMKDKCKELLSEYNITHAYFHEPLDFAEFGTCASLASALNLKNTKSDYCPFIGETEKPIEFEQFSNQLADILQEPIRAYKNNNTPIQKVCVVTGGGNLTNDIKVAVDYKCDTYITGEYVLYSQQYAKFTGINLLVGSHTNTEILGVRQMGTRLVTGTDIELIQLHEENY